MALACLAAVMRPAALPAEPVAGLISVGDCAKTVISSVGSYFADAPLGTAGVALEFTNGVSLVSQSDEALALVNRRGDHVTVCLESAPQNCPPGDDRGRSYRVLNRSAAVSFTLLDAPHMCGGA